MTHFLARLVERARGTAPRVEPIIAPRFAPAPVSETAPEGETPPVVRPAPGTSSPAEPAVSRVASEATKPSVTIRTRRDAEPAPLSADPPEAPLQIVREALLVPQPADRPEPDLSPVVRQTEIETGPDSMAENGGAREEGLPRPRTARPGPVIPAGPRALRGMKRAAESPNESRTEPPIVRVTIGRIEVRAAPAPSAPAHKPAPRSGPKLTLDAYLKSRQEGAR